MLDIYNKAILIQLNINQFTMSKTDKSASAKIEQDNSTKIRQATVNKKLFDISDTKKIKSILVNARKAVINQSLEWNTRGERLLPIANLERVNDTLKQAKVDLEIEIEEWKKNYQDIKDRAKQALGNLYHPGDYPPKEELDECFSIRWTYTPMPQGTHFVLNIAEDQLREITDELHKQNKEKIENTKMDLSKRLEKVINETSERLQALTDKKAKFVQRSIILNLQKTAETIKNLNITQDPKLDVAANELENVSKEVKYEEIQEDKSGEKVKRLKENLDKIKEAYL